MSLKMVHDKDEILRYVAYYTDLWAKVSFKGEPTGDKLNVTSKRNFKMELDRDKRAQWALKYARDDDY